jgi:hypothetical protein
MRAPSKKRLCRDLKLSEDQANFVRALIRGEVKTTDPRFPATLSWIDSCYNYPTYVERLMEALNEVICGCGVEGIEDRALYVNTGGAYSPTLLYSYRTRAVILTTWGDFVEGSK